MVVEHVPSKELVAELRADPNAGHYARLCMRAADDIDRLLRRLSDCELSLRVYDQGGASEYWLRHGQPTHEPCEGMDTPWPLQDVLAKLIEATEHLLEHHNCDAHGHEEFRTAANAGKELHARRAAPPPGDDAARFAHYHRWSNFLTHPSYFKTLDAWRQNIDEDMHDRRAVLTKGDSHAE